MSLVDFTTGLEAGTGLQFQKPIGGAGLINVTTPSVLAFLVDDTSAFNLTADDGATLLQAA